MWTKYLVLVWLCKGTNPLRLHEFFVPAVRQPVSSSAYTSICYFRLHQNQRDKKFKQYQIKTKSLYWNLNLPIRLQWPWDKPKIDNIIVEWITEANINIHVISKRVSNTIKNWRKKTKSKKINKKYDWFKKINEHRAQFLWFKRVFTEKR